MSMTYRQYLQYHANNHPSAAKRAEAQALLNVVGDDGGINGHFLTGEQHGFFGRTREQKSNGFSASAVNRNINPWWQKSYRTYQEQNRQDNPGSGDQPAPDLNYGGSGGRGGGGGINARERDYTIGQIDEALGEYDHQLGMLNEQERIGRRDIEDGYYKEMLY